MGAVGRRPVAGGSARRASHAEDLMWIDPLRDRLTESLNNHHRHCASNDSMTPMISTTQSAPVTRLPCARALHAQQFPDALDELLNVERLLHELIGPALEQVVDLVLV